jgi:CBS domain-containing protein
MIRLRDIMTKEVVTLDPHASIREAMELFTDQHVSGAPVVSGGEVVGVVSVTDLISFAASLPGPTEEGARLGEWESPTEPMPAYFAEILGEGGGGPPYADVVREWNALDEFSVAEVMTRSPIWRMSPDDNVIAAADRMREQSIHRVLVMDGNQLLGVVSATDIAKAVAEHRLATRTYVFDSGIAFDERGWREDE